MTERKMTAREIRRLAYANAASLVESMDLEQLYGDIPSSKRDQELFTNAQAYVVKFLRARRDALT